VEKEWDTFKAERAAGIQDIQDLRQRVADEEERKKSERDSGDAEKDNATESAHDGDAERAASKDEDSTTNTARDTGVAAVENVKSPEDVNMEVDEDPGKDDSAKPEAVVRADDEEAVEY
jgi:hypothetical protein